MESLHAWLDYVEEILVDKYHLEGFDLSSHGKKNPAVVVSFSKKECLINTVVYLSNIEDRYRAEAEELANRIFFNYIGELEDALEKLHKIEEVLL